MSPIHHLASRFRELSLLPSDPQGNPGVGSGGRETRFGEKLLSLGAGAGRPRRLLHRLHPRVGAPLQVTPQDLAHLAPAQARALCFTATPSSTPPELLPVSGPPRAQPLVVHSPRSRGGRLSKDPRRCHRPLALSPCWGPRPPGPPRPPTGFPSPGPPPPLLLPDTPPSQPQTGSSPGAHWPVTPFPSALGAGSGRPATPADRHGALRLLSIP